MKEIAEKRELKRSINEVLKGLTKALPPTIETSKAEL